MDTASDNHPTTSTNLQVDVAPSVNTVSTERNGEQETEIQNIPVTYQISLSGPVFAKLIAQTKDDTRIANCKNLAGSLWSPILERATAEHEQHDPWKLNINSSRLYPDQRRANTAFLTINMQCSLCCDKAAKKQNAYQFKIDESPDSKASFVVITVSRSQTHNHEKQHKQIRGEDRVLLAEECMLETNGSAKNFCDKLRGKGIAPPNVETVRKIVSEVINKEMGSTCWITNALSALSANALSAVL
jgi:hypothetical protein